jgi:hypothetical protein
MAQLDPTHRPLTRSPAFLTACAGVALLGIGSFAVVAIVTGPSVQGVPPPDLSVATAAPPPPAAPPVVAPPAPLPPEEKAARQAKAQAQRAEEAKAPAVTRLMPSRARALITRAIENQAPQLFDCFEQRTSAQGRRGDAPDPRPSRGEARALARIGATSRRHGAVSMDQVVILRLDLEPQHGELWIYDAAVEHRGGATDAQIACARRALKGLAVEMPGTTPGPHVAMPFPIP